MGHVDIRWNVTDQVGQECSGQQYGWSYWKSFKLDLMGEWDVLLSDRTTREHYHYRKQQGKNFTLVSEELERAS